MPSRGSRLVAFAWELCRLHKALRMLVFARQRPMSHAVRPTSRLPAAAMAGCFPTQVALFNAEKSSRIRRFARAVRIICTTPAISVLPSLRELRPPGFGRADAGPSRRDRTADGATDRRQDCREAEPAAPSRVAGFSPERRVMAPRSMGRLRRLQRLLEQMLLEQQAAPTFVACRRRRADRAPAPPRPATLDPHLSRNDPARLALQDSHDRP